MTKRKRTESGSLSVLLIFLVSVLLVPLLVALVHFYGYLSDRQRVQNVVDAASIVAANDLSRIVINDRHFGYVSLSNQPPTGKATCAPDGEPLPVTGINTLIGTVRHSAVIARELKNWSMLSLAHADRRALEKTISDLNWTLADALAGFNTAAHTDINGDEVDPIEDVTAFIKQNLPENMELQSVTLSNGWLGEGGTTTVPVPQPEHLARVHEDDSQEGYYKAFVDLPVDGQPFSFAGLGRSSSIVDGTKFNDMDDEHACSIVRLECTIVRKDRAVVPAQFSPFCQFQCVAFSQPYTQPDASTKGAMVVRFSGPPVCGIMSWEDFLRPGNFDDNMVSTYTIAGGDYPLDRDARMTPLLPDTQPSSSQQFAEHLYYWLRSGHVRHRIDAVLAMVKEPFLSQAGAVYVYEFTDSGAIARRTVAAKSFPPSVTADAQYSSVADTRLTGGICPVIMFRNNVRTLSTSAGGKHCGQPLAGYPLSDRDINNYTGSEDLAQRFCRRRLYNRGLALEIEIGGTGPSTAAMDVESMRTRLASRKI